MDEIDVTILSILCKDARTPFKKIALELGISTGTVMRRYKNLQKNGVILGSTVVFSSEGIGFKELVGYFIKIRSGASVSATKEKLLNIPKINMVAQEWGVYDFYVESFLRNLSEMHDVLDHLRKIEEITVICPMIYRQRDWTIPFLFPFPNNCPWLSPEDFSKNKTR